MTLMITVLHIFVCIFLVAVVLLQRGKGAEIGAVFGSGASSTVFGSRGAGTFLTKLTTGCAIVFMLTSLALSYLATSDSGVALFQDSLEQEAAEGESLFEEYGTVPPEAAAEAEAAAPAETEGDAP
jgi:preprotein translocase subunit SecG